MEHKIEKIKKILNISDGSDFDEYAEKTLKDKLYKWKNEEVEYLSDLEYFINGKKYDSILDAFHEVENVGKIKINFLRPNLDGPWNFSRPTKELKAKDEKGVCETFEYDPTSLDKWSRAGEPEIEKTMIRAFIPDFFVPISIAKKSEYHRAEEIPRQYEPRLKHLNEVWQDVRGGVFAFVIRLCLYTQKDRYTLLIDTINDKLRPHPLGDVTRIKKTDREAVDYLNFDKVHAWLDIPLLSKKIFELLFETEEMTVFDIADCLNLDKKVAENNLTSLESKGYVDKKKDIYYEINMDKIEKKAGELS